MDRADIVRGHELLIDRIDDEQSQYRGENKR